MQNIALKTSDKMSFDVARNYTNINYVPSVSITHIYHVISKLLSMLTNYTISASHKEIQTASHFLILTWLAFLFGTK